LGEKVPSKPLSQLCSLLAKFPDK